MKTSKAFVLCGLLLTFAMGAFGQSVTAGEKVKTSGLITARSGENLTLKTDQWGDLKVVLTDDTKVEQPKGLFKVRKQEMGLTALVPGLSIQLEGVGEAGGRVTAEKIKFSKEALQTANQIQAGLTPTNEAVQANKGAIASNQAQIASNREGIASNQQEIEKTNRRFASLDDYETKDTATLYYGVGTSNLDQKQKAELDEVAQKAAALQGYIIQVAGYTDSSGNAEYNQQLSADRAENVISYLQQNGNIPLTHIVAPGVMGESNPAASNESAQGRSENRRVVVKVLVNKGVAGQ